MFEKSYALDYSVSVWLDNIYPSIRELLNISETSDQEAIFYLVEQGIQPKQVHIKYHSQAICFGAAPELENYRSLLPTIFDGDRFVGSADGATRWLLEQDYVPDLVVSDLDGIELQDIEQLINDESQLQILVHGDNIEKVDYLISEIEVNQIDNISFVTQGQPLQDFRTALGFTDGDRLVSLICQHQMEPLLLGYNLSTDLIGRYSKPGYETHQPMTPRKRQKLEIAKYILKWLHHNFNLYTIDETICPGNEIDIQTYLKN